MMNYDNPDAPRPLSQEDLALARNLSEVRELRQFFLENLNSSLRAVFSHCDWRITCYEPNSAEMVIVCPNMAVYKRLRNKAEILHTRYRNLVQCDRTRFSICYPPSPNAVYEHEIDTRRPRSDWFSPDDFDDDGLF
jgi:hypothetical protein